MSGPVVGDPGDFREVGNFRTVPGVLRSLGVQGRPLLEQRKAVRSAWSIPSVQRLLLPLEGELRQRGLL